MEPNTATFDRRRIYRPFLEHLSPSWPGQDVIVPPERDPRDPGLPPIHVSFANTVELTRGSQVALVGGIGSGRTTELLLTLKVLKRHADAINIYLDLAELTDLNELNPGAILIAIGMQLYYKLTKADRDRAGIKPAYEKLRELANGRTEWVDLSAPGPIEDPRDAFAVHTPGLLKPRSPAMHRVVLEVQALVYEIAMPLLESGAQITILLDGLDRLIRSERFREFVEQDLRAVKEMKISLIVAAPLLSWFDKSRFLQDYFDDVKHIPAAISDPEKSDFLKQILLRRGAAELMDPKEMADLSRFSGGVLRDLITLARTSAEAAYRDGQDRVGPVHAESAIRQLGRRYLIGLGRTQRRILQGLDNEEFSVETPVARELLVNRQVLEYFSDGRDFFAVHPALAGVLAPSA